MRVALVFPGQGAQHPGMAAGLYEREPVFTAAMDAVFAAFGPAGARLRAEWLDLRPVDDVTRSTPLLFAVDYALAAMVRGWEIKPAALLGHSIGEVAAAVTAGVFSLAELGPVITARVEHLATAPAGTMLAVAAGAADVGAYLDGEVVVGAVNAPRQVVLSGPAEGIARAAAAMRRDGLICRAVPALSPFHSPAMAAAAALGAELYESMTPRPPALPVYSSFLGRQMTAADAADLSFWTGQPAAPVLFWPALEALLADGDFLLVEVGPGDGLSTIARQHQCVLSGRSAAVALLPRLRPGGRDDLASVSAARERLLGLVAGAVAGSVGS